MQNIMLDILMEVDKICRKHEIRYFLYGGTLLGAVRHQGFIPWDDDLDIALPRNDYEYLLSLAPDFLPDYYRIKNYMQDEYYPYTYAKIDDTRTMLVESSTEYIGGVYIDIFPLDGTPERGAKKYKCHVFKHKLFSKFFLSYFGGNDKVYKYDKLLRLYKRVIQHLNIKKIQKRYDTFCRKYSYEGSAFVGCLIKSNGNGFTKEWMGQPCELLFEGMYFFAPEQYHNMLSNSYGKKYMDLPPEKRRKSRHRIKHLDLERGYSTYMNDG